MQTEDADVYGKYIDETGFSAYKATPGNQGAWLLRRDDGGRTEFIAFTLSDRGRGLRQALRRRAMSSRTCA